MIARTVILVSALAAMMASPALADKCEVWKDREIRCAWERENQALKAKLALVNKTGAAFEATVNHWVSVCGVNGKHRSETKVSVPANGTAELAVSDETITIGVLTGDIHGSKQVPVGKTCTELFVACGSAKCADVLTAEQR